MPTEHIFFRLPSTDAHPGQFSISALLNGDVISMGQEVIFDILVSFLLHVCPLLGLIGLTGVVFNQLNSLHTSFP